MFYGTQSDEESKSLLDHLRALQKIYERGYFTGDMLVTFLRNMSFCRDDRFIQAFQDNAGTEAERAYQWRLHTLTWAAKMATRLPGDFVECGVFRGFMSAVVAEYIDFAHIDKTFYLYDSFEGLSREFSTEIEYARGNLYTTEAMANGYNYEAVSRRFASYSNIEVIKGVVPDVLHGTAPDEIAYLHIDLNAGKAEIAALDLLFDRVTPGGFVILDDYGHQLHYTQHVLELEWMETRGHAILELPTGQGLIVKQ